MKKIHCGFIDGIKIEKTLCGVFLSVGILWALPHLFMKLKKGKCKKCDKIFKEAKAEKGSYES